MLRHEAQPESCTSETVGPEADKGREAPTAPQRILVFQQNKSGESKVQGIRSHGGGLFLLESFSIDTPLPTLIDDTSEYLPEEIRADLVLDFLKHPDLSQDLAQLCRKLSLPLVASGKKINLPGVLTPPT